VDLALETSTEGGVVVVPLKTSTSPFMMTISSRAVDDEGVLSGVLRPDAS
jgi:hypothetical protein